MDAHLEWCTFFGRRQRGHVQKRILVLGEDRWSARLAEGLASHFPDRVAGRAVALSARGAFWRVVWALLRSDIVVRVGFPPPLLTFSEPRFQASEFSSSVRDRMKRRLLRLAAGRALRRAVLRWRSDRAVRQRISVDGLLRLWERVNPRQAHFTYWIGSDVLDVLEGLACGELGADYVDLLQRTRNITGVDRLTDELRSVGVSATTVPYPGRMLEAPPTAPPMPQRMTVLSYVPDTRREYYGLPALLSAATALGEVEFSIMGGDGRGLADVPRNVRFHGFVEDPSRLYAQSSVVVRLVEHDGAGYSMAEGLLFARPVIYSYATPHVVHVDHGDTAGLIGALSDLRDLHQGGGIPLNLAGREWALHEYDSVRRYSALCQVLTGAACS